MSSRVLSETKKLLIIEDDPVVLRCIASFLREQGMDVIPLLNGEGLDEWLIHEKADAVILDIKLRGKDGLEYIPKIKERLGEVPIVILTGSGYDEGLMQKAKELGAKGYVSKFLPPQELTAALSRAFDHS